MVRTFAIVFVACLLLAGLLGAEEKPPTGKGFYDLPREEVLEYRALQAEERAIRAEVAVALKEIEAKRAYLLDKWRERIGDKDLSNWQVDFEKGKLVRNGSKP